MNQSLFVPSHAIYNAAGPSMGVSVSPSSAVPIVVLPVPLPAGTASTADAYGFQYPGSYTPRDTPLHRFNGYVVCDPPNPPDSATTGTNSGVKIGIKRQVDRKANRKAGYAPLGEDHYNKAPRLAWPPATVPDIHNRRACSKKQRLLHNTFSLIRRTALSQSRYEPVKIKTRPFSRYAAACTAAVFALSGCPTFRSQCRTRSCSRQRSGYRVGSEQFDFQK